MTGTVRRVRRAAIAAAIVWSGVALAAFGPRYGGGVTVGVLELPAPGPPAPADGQVERMLASLVHEPLLDVGPEGLPAPGIVRGWSVGVGGREWTLSIQPGLTFHDDRPVSADDVARGILRFLRSESPGAIRLAATLDGGAAFRAKRTGDLPGVAIRDPQHLVLRFGEVAAAPLAPLAAPAAAPASPGGAGCGPFVPTAHVPGRTTALTAFAGHLRGRPYLDRATLVLLPDAEAARADLAAGRVDAGPGPGGPSALAATLLLVLDATRPPFDRSESRAAVVAALDPADLVRHFVPGGDPAPSLLPSALLAPLGLGAPPRATGTVSGSITVIVDRDVPPVVSQRTSAVLAGLGLRVQVTPAAPTAARASRAAARLLLFVPEVPEPGLALEELASLTVPSADARALLDAAQRETVLDRRRVLLHRAEAALRAGGTLVPLATAPVSFAVRRGLHGARVDLAGRLRLEDAWVEP